MKSQEGYLGCVHSMDYRKPEEPRRRNEEMVEEDNAQISSRGTGDRWQAACLDIRTGRVTYTLKQALKY